MLKAWIYVVLKDVIEVWNRQFFDHVELILPSQLLRVNVTIAISVLLSLPARYNRALENQPRPMHSECLSSYAVTVNLLPLSAGL